MSRRIAILMILCMFSVAHAQNPGSPTRVHTLTQIVPGIPVHDKSFVIVVDDLTFDRSRSAIMDYKRSVERQGLPTFVLSANWSSPLEIRAKLMEFYEQSHLEGVLLLGEIPNAYLCHEGNRRDVFVSDRYYDTFDIDLPALGFYTGSHSESPSFLFNIPNNSPGSFRTTIYSARIPLPVVSDSSEAYEQLNAFLQKASKAHSSPESLSSVLHFHDYAATAARVSYAQDLEEWHSLTNRLEEQFGGIGNADIQLRFLRSDNFPNEPQARTELANQLARREVNLAFLNTFLVSYLSINEGALGVSHSRHDPISAKGPSVLVMEQSFAKSVAIKESLFGGNSLVIRSAFSKPGTRSPINYLSGLLAAGARVGQWAQQQQTWKSQLLGDPTFRFAAPEELQRQMETLLSGKLDFSTLQALGNSGEVPDAQCLALAEIYRRKLPDSPSLLKTTFRESPHAVVRCTAFHLMLTHDKAAFRELVDLAQTDSDAIIRRNARTLSK